MSKISGLCPNCGSKLIGDEKETTVTCYACDSVVSLADITAKKSSASMGGSFVGGFGVAAMMGFDNPESGVVFVENFFDNYDWWDYQRTPDIEIDELEEVVYNNKMKNGAVSTAWYLDYKALAIPVRKKIEGLRDLAENIGEAYNAEDSTESYGFYDVYSAICRKLIAEKESIFKRLENAIKYAERFALPKERLAEMKADVTDLKALFEREVQYVCDINEIPAYVEAQEKQNKEMLEFFAQKGIDADSVYQEALQKYENSENKKAPLVGFECVRGYRDSVKYIREINQFFHFNAEMYRCFGRHFILKKENYTPTLNVSKLGQKDSQGQEISQSVKSLSLYEEIDKKPAEEAMVKGIVKLIACYGGKLFYIKEKQGVCSFDMYEKKEETVDAGKREQYFISGGYDYEVFNNGKNFYIIKRTDDKPSSAEASGCGTGTSAKNNSTENPVAKSTYDLIVVDMANNTAKAVLKGFSGELKHFGNKVFYEQKEEETIAAEKSGGCSATPAPIKISTMVLYVCDLVQGVSKKVLDKDCKVKAVHGEKIIYMKLQPNDFNQNLYVYDMELEKDTLIEENVYEYFDIYNDKLYYLVGNAQYCPLVRNSFDGTQREQFMKNVEKIITEIGGWLYIKKGRSNSYNSSLVKVNLESKKRVVLCTQLKRVEVFHGNYVYYTDVENNLRVVRIDGKKNVCIAKDICDVYPMQDTIYYTRNESVSLTEEALSLYKMDKDGDNISKLIFNMAAVCNDPITEKLYFKKMENTLFKCYEPKKEKDWKLEIHTLRKYYTFDKKTEKIEHVLTLDFPTSEAVQSGCSGEPSVAKVYEEIGVQTFEIDMKKTENQSAESSTKVPTQQQTSAGCGASNQAPNSKQNGGCNM